MATSRQTAGRDGGTYGSSAAAEAWRRGAAARADAMGRVTEMMLDLAGVGVGCRLLDVAAGTGEQTLMAARRVGPTGSVVATDIAGRPPPGPQRTRGRPGAPSGPRLGGASQGAISSRGRESRTARRRAPRSSSASTTK